jgi:TamB, inner membrane protein subunit of TAM complex
MTISEKLKKVIRRIYRITITTVLVLLGIILLILVLIQTGPVQNWGRAKMEAYLENKLHTRVRIGNLYIGFPSRIIIKNIYVEDLHKDTLISGGRIDIDISMIRLLHKELRVNNLDLDGITVKVKRQLPDSVFNFQFIPDAFGSTDSTKKKADSSAGFKFVIGGIHLHHVHALYADDATGNELSVNLGDFDTKLKTFDPALQHYSITDIKMSDISGKLRQFKPILLLQHAADTISEHNKNATPVQLELGEIDFAKINIDYRNDAENMDAGLRLGSFRMRADSIDLDKLHFRLKEITLRNTVAVLHFGRLKSVKTKNTVPANVTVEHTGMWNMDIALFAVDNTRLQYDNDNMKPLKKGMDFNHLDVNQLQVRTNNMHADPSNYRAVIAGISFNEKSGFVLKKLSTNLEYGEKATSLRNLVILTNRSEIRNQTFLQYKSLADLKKRPGDIAANLVFDKARIAVRDILIFVPNLEGPLKGNQDAVLRLNGKLNGQLKDLRIPYLEIDGLGNTSLSASGEIKGLPDAKNAYYDITISKLKTSRTDLFRFIPVKSIPDNIRIPENLALNGKFTGTIKRFSLNLHLITNEGNIDLAGTLDLNHKTYDLVARTPSINLGSILKQDSILGRFTFDASAKGSGFDLKKMNSIFHVSLQDGEFNNYNYRGLKMDANLQNGNGTIISSMSDPNCTYDLNAHVAFMNKYPSVKMNLLLDTIDLLALHLMSDSLRMHVQLNADFATTDPDALQGQLLLNDLGITHGTLSVHTDSVSLTAQHADSGQSIRLRSEIADIDWTGRYKLSQVTASLKHLLNNYYTVAQKKTEITEPEKWQMAIRLRTTPMLLSVMPSLNGTDSITGSVYFNSSEKNINLALHADKIQINDQVIHQLNITALSKDKGLDYKVSVGDFRQKGFQLYQSSVYGTLAHNKLSLSLLLKDKKQKNRYIVSGSLSEVRTGYTFVFNPDSLLLNYEPWELPADNSVHYDSAGLIVRNLKLTHKSESISFNTNGESGRSPLDLAFTNFKIKTITQFAEQDSLLLDGIVNGKAEIKNLFLKPIFTSDLKVDSLIIENDSLGNLVIQLNNEQSNAFDAHIVLSGHDNDVQVDGKYFTGESKMDLDIRLNQLNLASFKGLAYSQIKNMQGYLKGNLHASGNIDRPLLKGSLHFKDAILVPVITGEPLKLSDDVINFDDGGFDFDMFTMLDSAGNKATLDGNVFTKDFKNFLFDLSFSAQNFRAVNTPKEPNRVFYGKLNLNADLDVKGDMNLPKITSYIRVNKNTDFYVTLPSDDPEVVDREGVVIFTNNKHRTDSAQFKRFLDSLASTAKFKGMDLSVTIETDSSAQFTLIIDERNGDALTMRGRAELTGGVDKSGKVSLTGNYELVNGAYNLTLSVLHRRFDIQRGSVITWTGDPRTANIDISAIYTVNTAPIDLMQQQINQNSTDATRYKQRLPFQVKLNMTGELLKPIIKFDIALPDNLLSFWPDVDLKLTQMRNDVAEVNKQVFALLLLGRFVQENPFQSGSNVDAGTIARQSASKILSDQLNQLAGSLIKGVDVNFDLNSGQDYSSGTAQSQTDLNVKVSKSLFDERIRVTVGSDFQLEQTNPGQNTTNLAGDVSVDYRLSKDGRYMIRVYRKDQYETVVQAQVVETGLSFILTFDYNKFRELFENKKENPVVPIIHPHKENSNSNPAAK